jgi:RHH-type rel operon transcriptional repressor/antitoxin RelB
MNVKQVMVRRSFENKLKVVAVRIDPEIEQRLRLLAEATGRKQSFFLQQSIEGGIESIEATWLPPEVLAKVRQGVLPLADQPGKAIADLFNDSTGAHP